jgi:hypothetical protein
MGLYSPPNSADIRARLEAAISRGSRVGQESTPTRRHVILPDQRRVTVEGFDVGDAGPEGRHYTFVTHHGTDATLTRFRFALRDPLYALTVLEEIAERLHIGALPFDTNWAGEETSILLKSGMRLASAIMQNGKNPLL